MDQHTHPADHTHTHSRPHATDEIIICRNVHKWYGGQKVLDGTRFDVTTGSVTTIIGGSGAGKSVLIRLMVFVLILIFFLIVICVN